MGEQKKRFIMVSKIKEMKESLKRKFGGGIVLDLEYEIKMDKI